MLADVQKTFDQNLREYREIHPPQSGLKRYMQTSVRPARNAALIGLSAGVLLLGTFVIAFKNREAWYKKMKSSKGLKNIKNLSKKRRRFL